MRKPVCTVIIPSRNCLNFLPTAINCIVLQNCHDLEVIVADDGSTDGTAEWIAGLGNVGFPLRLISTGGVGPAAARNAALRAASSELIAFLDADDVWWPDKIARQIAFHLENPKIGFSFTDYIHVTPDGRTFGTCFEFWRCAWTQAPTGDYFQLQDAESKLLATNLVGTSTVVASRRAIEAVGGFSVDCRSAEDWDLWLRLAAYADVACSSAVTMSYLMRPASETANRERRLAAMREIVDRYRSRSEPAMRSAVRFAQARIDIARAEASLEGGDLGLAATAHLRALLAAPCWRTTRALTSNVAAIGRRLMRSPGATS